MRLAHVSSMHVSFDQLQQVVFHGQSTKMLVCCFSVKTSKSQEFLVKELLFSETQLHTPAVGYTRTLTDLISQYITNVIPYKNKRNLEETFWERHIKFRLLI